MSELMEDRGNRESMGDAEATVLFRSWLNRRSPAITLARGEEYFASGRVKELWREKTGWAGIVRGSESYSVWIQPARYRFGCTCPAPSPCKHVIALTLKLQQSLGDSTDALEIQAAKSRVDAPAIPSEGRRAMAPGVQAHASLEFHSHLRTFALCFRAPDGHRVEPRRLEDWHRWLPGSLVEMMIRHYDRTFSVAHQLPKILEAFPAFPEFRLDGSPVLFGGFRNPAFELQLTAAGFVLHASPGLKAKDLRQGFRPVNAVLALAPPKRSGLSVILAAPAAESGLYKLCETPMDLRRAVSLYEDLRKAHVKGLQLIPPMRRHGPLPVLKVEPILQGEDLTGLTLHFRFVYSLEKWNRKDPVPLKAIQSGASFRPLYLAPHERRRMGAGPKPGTGKVGAVSIEELPALRNMDAETAIHTPLVDLGIMTRSGNLQVSRKSLHTFFLKHLPEFRRRRICIQMSDSLLSLGGEKVQSHFEISQSSGTDWFGGQILIPGLSSRDMERALAAARRRQAHLLLEDGRWIRLEDLQLDRILSSLDSLGLRHNDAGRVEKISAGQATALVTEVDARTARLAAALRERILRWALPDNTKARSLPAPLPGFNGRLRPYQQAGLSFLLERHRAGIGGILADDMGLGKTIQGLALLNTLQREKRSSAKMAFLIVGPPGALAVWKNEAARFCPDLPVTLWHGPDRKHRLPPSRGVVLTSYGTLHRDEEILAKIPFETVLVDEAQYIKNHLSRAARSLRRLNYKTLFGLTGTPIENHPMELWSLMDLVLPGLLGTLQAFRRMHGKDLSANQMAGLRRRIGPFVLRRTRDAVLKDLPPRSVQDITVPMTHTQAIEYERVRREAVRVLETAGRDYLMKMLPYLMKLRRIACHPALGSGNQINPLASGKILHIADLVEELEETARGILVFSQFTDVLDVFGRFLHDRKKKYLRLDGSTTAKKRESLVREFQNGTIPYFLISLRAGGTALTLHRADTVLHLDPWWNPAVEEQATARAHRMGQQRPVFVYRFFSEGTVEEKVALLQKKKRALFDGLFGESQERPAKMERDDLTALLST